MTTYTVCDNHGNEITNGLEPERAWLTAQRIANRRGERVWLSRSDSDTLGECIEPEDQDDDAT